MVRRPEYSAADIEVVTLREAVSRRPAMYFGGHPPRDWPLVIAAWTAAELLDYQVQPARRVDLTLHGEGELSAAVAGARVVWSASARRLPAEDVVRRRMWWHHLCRSTTVTIGSDAAEPQRTGTELVWAGLTIVVRLAPDPDFVGIAPGEWWRDGPSRLREVLAAGSFELSADEVVVLDETAG